MVKLPLLKASKIKVTYPEGVFTRSKMTYLKKRVYMESFIKWSQLFSFPSQFNLQICVKIKRVGFKIYSVAVNEDPKRKHSEHFTATRMLGSIPTEKYIHF